LSGRTRVGDDHIGQASPRPDPAGY
jgi:hypothetical protein